MQAQSGCQDGHGDPVHVVWSYRSVVELPCSSPQAYYRGCDGHCVCVDPPHRNRGLPGGEEGRGTESLYNCTRLCVCVYIVQHRHKCHYDFQLIVAMLFCVVEWCMKMPISLLLETTDTDRSCVFKVFQVRVLIMTLFTCLQYLTSECKWGSIRNSLCDGWKVKNNHF